MEKKIWTRPEISVVQLMTGDYCISSCMSDGKVIDYKFNCNATPPADGAWSNYQWIFADNNSAVDDAGNRVFHYDAEKSFSVVQGYYDELNATGGTLDFAELIRRVTSYKGEYDQSFRTGNYFTPCIAETSAPSTDAFFSGWVVPHDSSVGFNPSNASEVTIWTQGGKNLHATYTLIENLEYSKS